MISPEDDFIKIKPGEPGQVLIKDDNHPDRYRWIYPTNSPKGIINRVKEIVNLPDSHFDEIMERLK